MSGHFHCHDCRNRIALIENYDLSVDDLENARFFTAAFNVEVAKDVRVVDGMNLAKTTCVQCGYFLGWKLIAASQPSRSHKIGGFYMRYNVCGLWNDIKFPDQDGGANEQNADQDGGANEQNVDQDGGSNEQNHDQDGGPSMKRMKK